MTDLLRAEMTRPCHTAAGSGKVMLDTITPKVYGHSMTPITDSLKEAIRNSGISNKKLEALSGVNRNSIARFMRGSTGLSLVQAEMLVVFFGIKLTKGST